MSSTWRVLPEEATSIFTARQDCSLCMRSLAPLRGDKTDQKGVVQGLSGHVGLRQ
jgi:hypothetical protein